MMNRVGKFVKLLRRLKVAIVSKRFVELAFGCRVIATNLRTRVIDAAAVIILEMFTSRMNQQIPGRVFHEHGGPIVQQVPTHKIEIALGLRRVDCQREVLAAFACAMVAQILTRFQLAAIKLRIGFSVHRCLGIYCSRVARQIIKSTAYQSPPKSNRHNRRMIDTILNSLQLLLIVVTPFVLFTLIIHRLERFTQHRLAVRFGWKSILWTGWLGTPIHELSHVAMCLVFRHRIDDVALFEPDLASGRLGYVRHSFTKSNWFERVGNVFIGLAPLAGGAIALATLLMMFYPEAVETALAQQQVQLNGQTFPAETVPVQTVDSLPTASTSPSQAMADSVTKFFESTATATSALLGQIFHGKNLQTKRFWCFLYLTLCVGSHMAPSRSDYDGARHGAMLLAAIVGAIVLLVSILGFDSISVSVLVMKFLTPVLAVMMLAIILCVVAAAIVYLLTLLFPVRYELR